MYYYNNRGKIGETQGHCQKDMLIVHSLIYNMLCAGKKRQK